MKPAAFLRSDSVRRILDRAARAAGMPVSIHHVHAGKEGPKITGSGGCASCRYVAQQPGGEDACRGSRVRHSAFALTANRPATYLCHMGFGCVAAPALPSTNTGLVLTMGPYCPAEAPELLVEDALRGLESLGHHRTPFFPVPLTDINHLRAESVSALAEWVVASLEAAWTAATPAPEPEPQLPAPAVRGRPRRLRSKTPDTSPYRGAEIVAALAAGDQTLARTLVKTALAEVNDSARSVAVKRARAVALAGSVLEAAERAGASVADPWVEFSAFVSAVRSSIADSDLAKAVMAVLTPLLPRRQTRPADAVLVELDRIVIDRLPETVRLAEVAARLEKHPTAITHHLQRKYGLSYSQYVGRLRIDKAKELLRRTRLGIGDVAARVGVADQSNFAKLFRKFEGVSPQQYRDAFHTDARSAKPR